VSRIQNLRKDSGLAVTDRVTVALDGVSAGIRQAVETHRDYISAEVLADSVLLEGPGSGASEILDVDGETARIFVAKA
jgi:isoleucyl-tRNA synthetase